MRFRNYLAEQYKKEDEVTAGSGKTKMALPLITIYLLGFKLSGIESSVIKVDRQYIDLITKEVIHQKSDFIEKLTHDSYVVQIPRIQPRLQSRLEALLTIFEQSNFADEREITRNYLYPVDDEQIKNIIAVLHHAGTDPAERVEIEKEQEAFRVFDLNFGKLRQVIEEKDKLIKGTSNPSCCVLIRNVRLLLLFQRSPDFFDEVDRDFCYIRDLFIRPAVLDDEVPDNLFIFFSPSFLKPFLKSFLKPVVPGFFQ
jgi:hypothetical protein